MKTITVYQSDNGRGLQNIYLTQSAALTADAKAEAVKISKKLVDTAFGHTRNHETLTEALTLLSEQAVSPGKLFRAYWRLWKIRRDVQAALQKEQPSEEEIPF